MNLEFEILKENIMRSGITKGMTILLHSSFKSLGLSKITPELLINAFQEVITEEGNLLIPTLTYKTVNKENPYFSLKNTPSCVGIVSETFRKMPNVYRSLDPVHSVAAWGKDAKDLTKFHYLDEITLGLNSPFYLMLKHDAKICMVGCTLKPNTFMHLVENLNFIPYRETKSIVTFQLIDHDNNVSYKNIKLPSMSHLVQRYDRIINILDEPQIQRISFHKEESFIIDANTLLKEASLVLKKNPFYFVDFLNK